MNVFSYGGGVQSTAALALAAQGKIDYQTFLFCNVGENSENPATLIYVNEVAKPYAMAHHIELVELQKTWQTGERAGQKVDLYHMLIHPNRKSPGGIPLRLNNGAPSNRACTLDFKIRVVDRWLVERGAKTNGAVVGLGISLDEWHRMRTDSGYEWKKLDYPLVDMRLSRQDCMNIIISAGLPVPPKSSCYFCPFHSIRAWQEMRQHEPELFKKACALEALLHERGIKRGKGEMWFTDKHKPLAMATTDLTQESLFDDVCESGYCMV